MGTCAVGPLGAWQWSRLSGRLLWSRQARAGGAGAPLPLQPCSLAHPPSRLLRAAWLWEDWGYWVRTVCAGVCLQAAGPECSGGTRARRGRCPRRGTSLRVVILRQVQEMCRGFYCPVTWKWWKLVRFAGVRLDCESSGLRVISPCLLSSQELGAQLGGAGTVSQACTRWQRPALLAGDWGLLPHSPIFALCQESFLPGCGISGAPCWSLLGKHRWLRCDFPVASGPSWQVLLGPHGMADLWSRSVLRNSSSGSRWKQLSGCFTLSDRNRCLQLCSLKTAPLRV